MGQRVPEVLELLEILELPGSLAFLEDPEDPEILAGLEDPEHQPLELLERPHLEDLEPPEYLEFLVLLCPEDPEGLEFLEHPHLEGLGFPEDLEHLHPELLEGPVVLDYRLPGPVDQRGLDFLGVPDYPEVLELLATPRLVLEDPGVLERWYLGVPEDLDYLDYHRYFLGDPGLPTP